MTNMLADTIKKKLQGVAENKTPEKFVMPERITDGNNAYVQRFKRRWDLSIEYCMIVKIHEPYFLSIVMVD